MVNRQRTTVNRLCPFFLDAEGLGILGFWDWGIGNWDWGIGNGAELRAMSYGQNAHNS